MALRITADRTFTHPVRTADGEDFTAKFKILPDDEFVGESDAENRMDVEKSVLRRLVTGLSGIEGEDGNEMPFDAALLEWVIGYADLRIALLRAYNDGRLEARRGN